MIARPPSLDIVFIEKIVHDSIDLHLPTPTRISWQAQGVRDFKVYLLIGGGIEAISLVPVAFIYVLVNGREVEPIDVLEIKGSGIDVFRHTHKFRMVDFIFCISNIK